MKFWDSSALVPLALRQPASDEVTAVIAGDSAIVLWWATLIECQSALCRAVRDRRVSAAAYPAAREALGRLQGHAFEVQPSDAVRRRALRLLGVHDLRAAASLQLAAALEWCEERTEGAGFVCLDGRLRRAAGREGFAVLPWSAEVHEPYDTSPPAGGAFTSGRDSRSGGRTLRRRRSAIG